METVVFPRHPKLFSRVVQVRLNTDDGPLRPRHSEYQQRIIGSATRPAYALVRPDALDAPLSTYTLPPSATTEAALEAAFIAWLEPALAKLP